jgi:hypothetical protein
MCVFNKTFTEPPCQRLTALFGFELSGWARIVLRGTSRTAMERLGVIAIYLADKGEAVRLLWLFAFALVLGSGCASDGRYSWDDVLKDARGDNMQMSSGWGSSSTSSDQSQTSNSNK